MSEQVKKYQMSDVLLNPSMAVLFMPKFVVSHDDYATLQAEYRRVRGNQNTLIARVRRLENELAASQDKLAAIKAQEQVAWMWNNCGINVTTDNHLFRFLYDCGADIVPLYPLPAVNPKKD